MQWMRNSWHRCERCDEEEIRMIIACGRKNLCDKQRLNKDYFRLIIRTSYGQHLKVFPSISIANLAIIQNTTQFSLSHAPRSFLKQRATVTYSSSNFNGTCRDRIQFVTKHIKMLIYPILSLYGLCVPLPTSSLTTLEFYFFNII